MEIKTKKVTIVSYSKKGDEELTATFTYKKPFIINIDKKNKSKARNLAKNIVKENLFSTSDCIVTFGSKDTYSFLINKE